MKAMHVDKEADNFLDLIKASGFAVNKQRKYIAEKVKNKTIL